VVSQVNQAYAAEDLSMQTQLKKSALLIIGSSALALLVGLIAAWVITRLIVAPLRRVIAVAQQIAAGDLSGRMEVSRRDEIGQLMLAMQQMGNGLSQMVSGLQAGIEQLASSAHRCPASPSRPTSKSAARRKKPSRSPRR
jgi:methyl-accepting chemotaxis protein